MAISERTTSNKIQRAFSTAAQRYDSQTGLQRTIAQKLLAEAQGHKVHALLDVGCGTGYLTAQARDHFSASKIIGVDFSEGMLQAARQNHAGIDWVMADIKSLPFSDGCFDLLLSNLAYQWVPDLARAFSEARRLLVPGGILACTLFGYHTCDELFQCLNEAGAEALKFTRLPDHSRVVRALAQCGFQNPMVSRENLKIKFQDMHELTGWLKSIGANNLPREGYVGKQTLARAADIYRERFGLEDGVQATFEVIWVYAKR